MTTNAIATLRPSSTTFVRGISNVGSHCIVRGSNVLGPRVVTPIVPCHRLNRRLSVVTRVNTTTLGSTLTSTKLRTGSLSNVVLTYSGFRHACPTITVRVRGRVNVVNKFTCSVGITYDTTAFNLSRTRNSVISNLTGHVTIIGMRVASTRLG